MKSQNQARTSTLPSKASRASGMRVVRFRSGTRFHQSVSIISAHYNSELFPRDFRIPWQTTDRGNGCWGSWLPWRRPFGSCTDR